MTSVLARPTARPAAAPTDSRYPPVVMARCTLALLLVVYVLSFIDRQGIALLVGPIRADLAISDTRMSLVMGLAFSLLYTVLGIPAGVIADRGDRRALIGAGLLLWSIATCCSGLATSFGQLFAARVGVGVGEATLMPAAFSLIRDSFPPDRRGRAYSVFSMGLMVGSGLAFLFGGVLVALVVRTGPIEFAWFGVLKPWRAMLVCAGLTGIPVAALLFALREPARRHAEAAWTPSRPTGPLRHLVAGRAVYGPLFLAISLSGVVAAGFLTWMPSVLGRTWHLDPATIGIHYGFFLLVLAPTGMLATGFAMDRIARSGRRDGGAAIGAFLAVLIVPLVAFAPVAASETAAWIALAVYILIGTGIQPAAAAALSALTPAALLGRVTSLYFLFITVVAAVIGPTLIASLSDHLLKGPNSLGTALAIVSALASAAAAALFALTARRMRRRDALGEASA